MPRGAEKDSLPSGPARGNETARLAHFWKRVTRVAPFSSLNW